MSCTKIPWFWYLQLHTQFLSCSHALTCALTLLSYQRAWRWEKSQPAPISHIFSSSQLPTAPALDLPVTVPQLLLGGPQGELNPICLPEKEEDISLPSVLLQWNVCLESVGRWIIALAYFPCACISADADWLWVTQEERRLVQANCVNTWWSKHQTGKTVSTFVYQTAATTGRSHHCRLCSKHKK